jgi:hypothetical protein
LRPGYPIQILPESRGPPHVFCGVLGAAFVVARCAKRVCLKSALTDLAARFGQLAFVCEPVVDYDYESSRAGPIKRDLPSEEVRSAAAAAGLGVVFLVAGLIGASNFYEMMTSKRILNFLNARVTFAHPRCHFPKMETTSGVISLSDGEAPPNLFRIDRIFWPDPFACASMNGI